MPDQEPDATRRSLIFQIFYLSVVKELGAPRVAQTLGVSAAQVYLVKHRVAALMRHEIQQLEAHPRFSK